MKQLISLLAQFVQGDIKGGEHATAFRVTTITTAIEQMLKGNYSPIMEAATLTEGKAKKARAYHAGFATFGVIGTDTKKVDYVGALNSAANVLARNQIASQTKVLAGQFFVAFDAVMAEKPTPKAKAAPAPSVTPAAPVAAAADTSDIVVVVDTAEEVSIDDLVATMVNALSVGMLDTEQCDTLLDAIRAAQSFLLPAAATPALAAAH